MTFTFTGENYKGTQFGVEGFDVEDIEASYSGRSCYELTLADFRVDTPGLVYGAPVDQILDETLRIEIPAVAARSIHVDK